MKKIIIPTILAATILIAGAFAVIPVENASTVHSQIVNPAVEGLVDVTDQNANNLDDAAEIIATAARAGVACVTVSVTDDAGGNNDPAVNINIGGVTVASPNPDDTETVVVDQCAVIAAAETVVFDQQGADSADGGNTVSGEVVIIADAG